MKKISILMLILFVVVCFSGTLMAKETVTIYTSVPTEIMTDIEKSFEAEHPDIDLEVFRSGTGTLQAKIATETETNNIQADIVWLADFAYYETLKKEGLLKQISPAEGDQIPGQFKDEDGYYFAGRLINNIIVYNSDQVTEDEAPTNWTDLTDEKWEDMVVMANPEYSGAVICAAGGLANYYGWDFFEQLRANEVGVVKGNGDVANKVGSGEYKVGIVLDYMIRGMKAEGSPVEIVYPEDGFIGVPSPIAIMKESDKVDASLTFVNYILSKQGQKTLVEKGKFIPVREDVEPPTGTPPASSLLKEAMEMDWGYIEENLQEIKDNFADIMLY